MKKIIGVFILLVFFSCRNEKTEFVQSKAIPNVFLLKNLPLDSLSTKKMIRNFLLKNSPKEDTYFYEYTWRTKYFIDHEEDYSEEPSGEELGFYTDAQIAVFMLSKCKNDTTKLAGELRYYNKYGDYYEPDTIIGKCK